MTEQERLDGNIKAAFEELKDRYGGVLNDYYGLVYMERVLQIPRKDALEQVAFGNADRGIDGVAFDPESGIFRILQFKRTKDRQQLYASMQTMADRGIKSLFDRTPVPDHQQILDTGRRMLSAAGSGLAKVLVQFVFLGDQVEVETGATVNALVEQIERHSYLFEQIAGHDVDIAVQARCFDGLLPEKPPERHSIRLEGGTEISAVDGTRMLVAFAPLVDLSRIYNTMGARFLERNVRFGLGSDGHVNKALSRAFRHLLLREDGDPSAFAIHHNGVTLAAHDVQRGAEQSEILSPRLLNGAQTISTFSAVCEDLGRRMQSIPADRVEGIKVLCRVVLGASQESVTRITIDTNRQNPVDAWLLHANDPIQVDFQSKFQKLGIFYQRQASAFEALTEEERDQSQIIETRPVEMIKLARTYLAAEGDITRLSRLGEIAESEKQYAAIFNTRRLDFDFRVLVLCYKMQFNLNKVVAAIVDTVTNDRYAFVRRGREIVWGLTCQALLNDDGLKELARQFGADLRRRAEYVDHITSLAKGPVRSILWRLISENDELKRLVNEGSLSFLRKSATFDKAMAIANRDFKWKLVGLA
jgi:hypothetical protein